ncbi:MAG: hypothetical protein EAZ30_17225 [Betaproteobacteria bacterium]|nr:MAG: hypothetical protein EAZ30_17225 [Betaproteobacteria bacterium]
MKGNKIFYHGSPCDRLELDSRTLFLTQDIRVAKCYANGQVGDTPTVYSILPKGNMRVLDLRDQSQRDWYKRVRVAFNKQPAFEDDQLPKLEAVGFIQATGLPGYGTAGLFKLAFESEFDAVLLDEGSQGVSLAVFNPGRSLQIAGKSHV